MNRERSTFCCNPFKKKGHWIRKDVRTVTPWMTKLVNYNIEKNMKICDYCRIKLGKERKFDITNTDNASISEATDYENISEIADNEKPGCSTDDSEYMDTEIGLNLLNASLATVGESPVMKKKCTKSKKYCHEKMEKIKFKIGESFFDVDKFTNEKKCDCDDVQAEIIAQFKTKFETANKNERFLILTSLPKSWSCARIEREFGVSNYIARKVKKLVDEKGILSSPDPKPGRPLSNETALLIDAFYCSDDISRQMPGKKDYVSIGRDTEGKPIHLQKRLILGNLREIYKHFKDTYPSVNIGFSKFAELRPKNCVIAGSSGTHCVCVCTLHQNIKLMIIGANLQKIKLKENEKSLDSYKSCISKIVCNPPNKDCYLNKCDNCPKINSFKDALQEALEEEMIENITYKQWMSVDRCSFETITKQTEDFVQDFCNKLLNLKRHDFIAKQQSLYFSEKKASLLVNEAVVVCDFSENYSFVLQDSIQGFHWNNAMATIHPCVVYYKTTDNQSESVLTYNSCVFVSDCLTHNTVLVHVFQRKIINYIKHNFVPCLKKVYYFSDGSSAQYKNRKNFINLCYHNEDFDGVEAEWHFYATSHGKGVCDGIGGTVKRLAAKASLQKPVENQIVTPFQLYEWGKENIPSVTFFYVTNDEYLEEEKSMKKRFSEAIAISGTQKFHGYFPLNRNKIKTKVFSDATEFIVHTISMSENFDD